MTDIFYDTELHQNNYIKEPPSHYSHVKQNQILLQSIRSETGDTLFMQT
jgi:hypothetical protein